MVQVAVFPNDLKNLLENVAPGSVSGSGEYPPEVTSWLQSAAKKGMAKFLVARGGSYDRDNGCLYADPESILSVKNGLSSVVRYFKAMFEGHQALPAQHQVALDKLVGVSFDQACSKAEAWEKWAGKHMTLPEGSERVVYEHGNVRIVEMMNGEALKLEATRMGHCIDNGDYDEYVGGKNGFRQYSVRDAKNEPHCTIEVAEGEVLQCEGKIKGDVLALEYRECVRDFIMERELFPRGGTVSHGLLKSGDRYFEWTDLKLGTVWDGDLDLSNFPVEIPKNLTVNGDLLANDIPDLKFTEGLKVQNNVHIRRSEVTQIHPSVQIGGKIAVTREKAIPFADLYNAVQKFGSAKAQQFVPVQ